MEKLLFDEYPSLSEEWNFDKNGNLNPNNYQANSHKIVWWKCKLGHEWQTSIHHRTLDGSGCPYCCGQKVLVGFNDLASNFPDIAKQWDYDKNIGIYPNNVLKSSAKKVWWICDLGHEWQMEVRYRTQRKLNCPYCSGQKVLIGFNDLEFVNPKLAREWNYDKNYPFKPSEVTKFSNKKVWWKCNLGHEWQATVYNRNKQKTNCPYCSGQFVLQGFNDLATLYPDLVAEWNVEKMEI